MTERTGLTCGRAICGVLVMLAALPLQAQESVIYNFQGGNDGSKPTEGFELYKSSLYGTLTNGGSAGVGEVFRFAPPTTGTTWTKRALYNFGAPGNLGGSPAGGVVADASGNLYGATLDDNSIGSCCGVIYELSPPAAGQTAWTENIIYSFTGGLDGATPHGRLAIDQYGGLYGVTHIGGGGTCDCGTVFSLRRNLAFGGWFFEVLYTFTGGNDGSFANGDLLIDNTNGYIFGTTTNGGSYKLGNVYALIPATTGWSWADIHDFEGDATDAHDGATPNGGLVGATGDLFGTTSSGGASEKCCGILFELREEIAGNPYTLINHHSFTGGQDGAVPQAGLYEDSSHNLWGTTWEGGSGTTGSDFGTIFELYPDRLIVNDWHYTVAHSFNGGPNDGANPDGRLVANSKGVLYGITENGGQSNNGVVYEFKP